MRIIQEEYFQQKLDQEKNKRFRRICSFEDYLRKGRSTGVSGDREPLLNWVILFMCNMGGSEVGGGLTEPRSRVRVFKKKN